MAAKEYTTRDVDGHEPRLSTPADVFWPARDGRPPITKAGEPRRVRPARAKRDG
jgi:hypothetical protein